MFQHHTTEIPTFMFVYTIYFWPVYSVFCAISNFMSAVPDHVQSILSFYSNITITTSKITSVLFTHSKYKKEFNICTHIFPDQSARWTGNLPGCLSFPNSLSSQVIIFTISFTRDPPGWVQVLVNNMSA